jgi:hypothetical protein
VTDRAARFVELGVRAAVRFEKFRRVIGGPQFCAGAMALLTTEGQLDLVVAHQAIGHLRHLGARDGFGCFSPSVAGQARVGAVEMLSNVAGRREVLAGVDGLRNDRRNIAELQVPFVAEIHKQRLRRCGDVGARVAGFAGRRGRQIVVLDLRALRNCRVTACTIRLQLQMQLMRERAIGSQRGNRENKDAGATSYN